VPGPASGVSPRTCASVGFQVPSAVTSNRAQKGTLVSAGTGLGNVEGGRILVQLNLYSAQEIHSAPWHASQALMREYAMVLHSHKSVSSEPLGPEYEYPGWRGLMTNEPPLHVDNMYAATVHGSWLRLLNVQAHVARQLGAEIAATAKPKRNKDVSSMAKSDIWYSITSVKLNEAGYTAVRHHLKY